MILCKMDGDTGEYRLKEIEEKIDVDYLHFKYNFIILPVNNNETFSFANVNNKESSGIFGYSTFLKFLNNEILEIVYKTKNAKEIKNIRLNGNDENNNNDLLCEDSKNFKICKIHRNYFKKIKNGYFYTSYKNNCGKSSILYEIPPIAVILKNLY